MLNNLEEEDEIEEVNHVPSYKIMNFLKKPKQTENHHQQKETSNQSKCSEIKNCVTATGRFVTIKASISYKDLLEPIFYPPLFILNSI